MQQDINRMIRIDLSEVSIPEQRLTGDGGVSHVAIWGTTIAEGQIATTKTSRQVCVCSVTRAK